MGAALLLMVSVDAAAICVEPNPPCQKYWAADAVFIGRVTDFRCRVIDPDPLGPPADEVHFEVIEAFRGVTERFVVLRDWVCGDARWSVSVEFRRGETYFVYAFRRDDTGDLGTSSCSTTTLADAAESVAYVRTLREPSTGGRVFGDVYRHQSTDHGAPPAGGLPADLVVRLTGPAGTWSVSPTADGRFSFDAVPPGRYELTRVVKGPYVPEPPVPVNITAPHACQVAWLGVSSQGTVRGRVLDAGGRAVPDAMLALMDVDAMAPPEGTIPYTYVSTDDKGEFVAARLGPGEYVLGLNLLQPPSSASPYLPTWFPGVQDRDAAQVIRITPGTDVDLGDLLLPPALKQTTVTGRALLPDGSPARGAMIWLFDEDLQSIVDERALIGPDGRFVVPAFAGRRYVVEALVQDGPRVRGRSDPIVAGESGPVVIRLSPIVSRRKGRSIAPRP